MSRGPVLRITEVRRAAELHKRRGYRGKRVSWRMIGQLLQRDYAGLRRAVQKYESTNQ